MGKIGNKELSRVLTEKHGLERSDADRFVELMFDVLNNGLKEEKLVKVKGLGTFKVTSVAPRKSVDVNTGEPIVIEGRDKISFTPDNSLRDQVNRPFAQFDTVVLNDGVDFTDIDSQFADSMVEQEGTANEDEDEQAVADSPETAATPETAVASEPVATPETAATPEPVAPSEPVVMPEAATVAETEVRQSSDEVAQPAEVTGTIEDAEEEVSREFRPMMLSASQLDVLNGADPMKLQKETATPKVSSEPEPQPTVEIVEPEEAESPTTAVQEPLATPAEETQVDRQAGADGADAEEENSALVSEMRQEKMFLEDKLERQHKRLSWLVGLACVLLGLMIGGVVYMFDQLERRDNRIRYLEAQAALTAKAVKGQTASLVDSDAVRKAQADRAEAIKAIEAVKAADQAERKAEAQANSDARKTAPEKVAQGNTATASPSGKKEMAVKEQVKTTAQADKQQAEYEKDVRIRTGAYRIVGIDRTVTVRAGQTLASISKANLGPGMECYIEAVNGGRREFKAGEKVNIPALKLKKTR